MAFRICLLLVAGLLAGCGSDGGETTAAGGDATCESASFVPALEDELNAEGVDASAIEVRRCQKGYAEVGYGAETVFLEALGGEWTVIESGTGISCNDADVSEKLRTACESLAQPG